jgi:NADH dehydrogenase FAD-containing subunit
LDKLKEKGIKFLNHEIASIDLSDKSVTTATTGDRTNNNNKLVYDYLIIALGAEFAGIF